MAASAAVMAALVVLGSSPQETAAAWRESADVTLPDGRTDSLGMVVQDATNAVNHTQNASSDVANEPTIRVTNTSARQTSWIDVVSTRLAVPASNTSSTLASKVDVDYDVGVSCETGLSTPPYWNVANAGVGGLQVGTTYSRPSAKVAGDVLAPGQSASLCPWVRPDYATDTAAGRSAFLLAHAGRQLDIATVVRQRSETPATWSSDPQTVTTRFQVKLPPPTRPASDGVVCHRTGLFGERLSIGSYGRLYWAWPFSGQHGDVTTPAVNRFVLLRSTDGQTWTELRQSATQDPGAARYSYAGSRRSSDNVNSSHLANNSATPVWLSVRAYLYSGSDVYVDADWMVQVSEGTSQLDDYFTCRTGGSPTVSSSGTASPDSSPHGL